MASAPAEAAGHVPASKAPTNNIKGISCFIGAPSCCEFENYCVTIPLHTHHHVLLQRSLIYTANHLKTQFAFRAETSRHKVERASRSFKQAGRLLYFLNMRYCGMGSMRVLK